MRSQIDRILREASSEGKVPPASVQKLVDSALAATNGKLTEETIAWLEEHVANLPVLVNIQPAREPVPGYVPLSDEELGRALAGWPDLPPPKTPPPPDWAIWGHMASCELWQAVVLSLGFDPGYFELWNDGAGNHYPLPPQVGLIRSRRHFFYAANASRSVLSYSPGLT